MVADAHGDVAQTAAPRHTDSSGTLSRTRSGASYNLPVGPRRSLGRATEQQAKSDRRMVRVGSAPLVLTLPFLCRICAPWRILAQNCANKRNAG
jgi:hypothetical protein